MTVSMKWTVDPMQFMQGLNLAPARIVKELSEEIFDGVVDRSPVDTGSFRASWNVKVGSPDLDVVDGGSSKSPLPAPQFPNIDTSSLQPVYITNNQPYGVKLEHGHSDQAPQGIVALTIASLK